MNKLIKFFKDEEGAELVEWTVFVAVLVISIVAAIGLLRDEIITTWAAIQGVLTTAVAAG